MPLFRWMQECAFRFRRSQYLAGVVLKMVIKGDDVDAVPIEPHRLKQAGYLDAMLQCLRLKHRDHLLEACAVPQFYLEAGSKMNGSDFDQGFHSG